MRRPAPRNVWRETVDNDGTLSDAARIVAIEADNLDGWLGDWSTLTGAHGLDEATVAAALDELQHRRYLTVRPDGFVLRFYKSLNRIRAVA